MKYIFLHSDATYNSYYYSGVYSLIYENKYSRLDSEIGHKL